MAHVLMVCRSACLVAMLAGVAAAQPVPPPPVPPENPITEPKRVLGKVLFFDEQLSTGNTVACATCHVTSRAGADPRLARNPGPDGALNTPDDRLASPGVIRSNSANDYFRDAVFGVAPQITSRAANSPINAAYAQDTFWDGRARSQFIDPETGQVAIANGGGLESQVVGPPMNSVEMAHDGMNWPELTAKLARVRPLDLATNIPADVATALANRPDYPELFRRAFGDTQITARRIAFAIATYERTLISNQSPFDLGTLTPNQLQGQQIFQANCAVCHTPPLFSNQTFRNIGLRPPGEDLGRQLVTGNPADRGRFKVPTVRNVALRTSFMHNGQFNNLNSPPGPNALQQVIDFYARVPGAAPQFPDNRDPAMQAINLPGPARAQVDDFIRNGLLDPRVANQTFPFDRATLYTNRQASQPTIVGGGTAGSGGIIPQIIASDPPMVGNQEFRLGLDRALGGASATLIISTTAPVNGQITPDRIIGGAVASSGGAGDGLATLHWPLTAAQVSGGQVWFAQWLVTDAAAPGGIARSTIARLPVFCGSSGCPPVCGYANCDGSTAQPVLNVADFACFLNRFASGDLYANCDQSTTPPLLTVNDFGCFLNAFASGCR